MSFVLGAYRFNDDSLVTELKRDGSLTNNLRYALNYAAAGTDSVLSIRLLDTNSVVLAASEDLLTSSNVDHYVFIVSDAGNLATNTVLLVNVPTAEYPDAAVIQLMAAGSGPVVVGSALLYIDEDADGWTATDEIRNGTSDYIFDARGGVISNYSDWVNGNNGGSSTNLPDGNGGGSTNNSGGGPGAATGYIYVSQSIGSDNLTGRAPEVRGSDGPKKTISQGLAAVEQDGAHTLIINSGAYGEDLDLRGKGVAVVIAGNVKL